MVPSPTLSNNWYPGGTVSMHICVYMSVYVRVYEYMCMYVHVLCIMCMCVFMCVVFEQREPTHPDSENLRYFPIVG